MTGTAEALDGLIDGIGVQHGSDKISLGLLVMQCRRLLPSLAALLHLEIPSRKINNWHVESTVMVLVDTCVYVYVNVSGFMR